MASAITCHVPYMQHGHLFKSKTWGKDKIWFNSPMQIFFPLILAILLEQPQ